MKLVLDIETIPCENSLVDLLPTIALPVDLTEEEKIREWEENILPSLQERQHYATALNGTFGRIVCIGLMALAGDNKPQEVVAIYGNEERKLVVAFWEKVKEYNKPYFITYNGLVFDLPFIWKRSVVHQIRPTMEFNLRHYSNDSVYDVMAIWSNWRPRDAPKLDVLSRILGVGKKSSDGEEVHLLWREEKLKEIADYCLHDVYLTYGCYCRMNFIALAPRSHLRIKYLPTNP